MATHADPSHLVPGRDYRVLDVGRNPLWPVVGKDRSITLWVPFFGVIIFRVRGGDPRAQTIAHELWHVVQRLRPGNGGLRFDWKYLFHSDFQLDVEAEAYALGTIAYLWAHGTTVLGYKRPDGTVENVTPEECYARVLLSDYSVHGKTLDDCRAALARYLPEKTAR